MKNVKWFFVVLLIFSLVSFIEKDKSTGGLSVGSVAPDFQIKATNGQSFDLASQRGRYVLLSFWASYDAPSRALNAQINRALNSHPKVELVSVSFDEYQSVYQETVRMDRIVTPSCFVEAEGAQSELFEEYRLKSGFGNYLLDENGIIIAKNISATELTAYLN